jgi:hypothetical protein
VVSELSELANTSFGTDLGEFLRGAIPAGLGNQMVTAELGGFLDLATDAGAVFTNGTLSADVGSFLVQSTKDGSSFINSSFMGNAAGYLAKAAGDTSSLATMSGPSVLGEFLRATSEAGTAYATSNAGTAASNLFLQSAHDGTDFLDLNFVISLESLLPANAGTGGAALESIYVISSGTISVPSVNGLLESGLFGDGILSGYTVAAGSVPGNEGGTFLLNADGSFTYTPPPNFGGFDYATYAVSDAAGAKATASVNVLSQTGGVVWKFYEQVLHRDPDPAGLQHWINDFTNGGKTGDIAVGFFESPELLNQIIGAYYQQYLGRAADSGGLSYYEDLWHKTGGPEQIKAGFAASPEFNALAKQQYGAYPNGWLEALYHRILNRTPDQNGFTYWQQQLASGTSEYQVALDFFQSPEAYDNDVTGWFYEYLNRAPTPAEQSQFASQMIAGANDRAIEQDITNLPEYANNPSAPPAGTGVPLPNYLPQISSSAQQTSSVSATDALFSKLGN